MVVFGGGVIGTAWVVHQFSPSLLGLSFPLCNIWFSTFSTTEILAHLEESLRWKRRPLPCFFAIFRPLNRHDQVRAVAKSQPDRMELKET